MPELHWHRLGVRRDGDLGTPVPWLALHGFTGWGGDFAALELGGFTAPVLAPDLPGHARSDDVANVDAYELGSTARSIVEHLDRIGVERVNLLGYSMGGRLGLTLTCLWPARVRLAVFVGASPGLASPAERTTRAEADRQLAARVRALGAPAFLAEWANHPLIASQRAAPAPVRDVMAAGRAQHTAAGLALSLERAGAGAMSPLHERLQSLELPALFLAGEHDARYRATAAELARCVRGAKHAAVEGCGHAPHLENPAAFVGILTAFAAQHAPHRPRTEP